MTNRRPDADEPRRELVAAAQVQARLCREGGSPTYAALIDELSRQVADGAGRGQELLVADGDEPRRSAVYLRLLAAVDRAVQERPDELLRACYPKYGGTVSPDAAVAAFVDLVEREQAWLAAEMGRVVQTNEVGRAAVLAPALSHVAAQTGQPCQVREVGASAGLNLSLDRYRIEIGHRVWGDPSSPVVLSGRFVGGSPPAGSVRILDRAGCDLKPVDTRRAGDRRLLRSFIWPELVQRAQDLDAAMDLAEAGLVQQADAVEWVSAQAQSHRADATLVVMHSVVTTYFSKRQHDDWMTALEDLASHARGGRVAWVSLEPDPDMLHLELRIAVDDPHQARVMATCTPHGRDIVWRSDD